MNKYNIISWTPLIVIECAFFLIFIISFDFMNRVVFLILMIIIEVAFIWQIAFEGISRRKNV